MRSPVRAAACAAIVALAMMSPASAHAADPKAQQDLEQAEQGLVNLDYENANKLAARLATTRGLTHEQLVRTYRVLALTNAVLDKETQARDAFQLLLTYDPTYQGDPNLGPKVQAPFMEARGFMRAQAVQPGAEASVVVHAGEPGTIRLTVRDPLHVAKRAVVGYRWGGEGGFQTSPAPVGEGAQVAVPPPPPRTSRLDYYAQVLDEHDSVVFEVGNPNVPKSTTIDLSQAGAGALTGSGKGAQAEGGHSVVASPWFWVAAVAVVGGGVTAVALATHKSSGTTETLPPTGVTLGPSLVCGSAPCR